jgi:outer membrane protein
MKKLSLVLYIVLFLAVAVLFYLHFSGNSNNKEDKSPVSPVVSSAEGIAFVNIDTLIFKFDMFFDRRAELMAKQKKAETELNSKGSQYEKNARDFQEKVNKGLVTRATAAEMEQSLLQQQQEVVTLRDKLQSNLMEEEQVMNRQIIEYITSYLAANKSEYQYQFILGKSFGSVVLYGDGSLDITQKVLDAINKKYKTEKK